MKKPPELGARSARGLQYLAATLAMAAGLVGCGPGTGGTGTGPGIGSSLAEGSYGATLDQTQPSAQPLPCGSQCGGQVALLVSDARVELNLPCQRFVYEGSWSFDAQGRADLVGRWQQLVLAGGTTVLQEQSVRLTLVASLPDAQDLRLQLTVTDLSGTALLGPVNLEQQSQSGAAISCLLTYIYQ